MPFVEAANYTQGRSTRLRLIVAHDMEAPEGPLTAENVARFFAGQARSDSGTSAHCCVDDDSHVECVHEEDTAWAAPNMNSPGYQIEQAGYARQTRAEWLDPYSRDVLDRFAHKGGHVAKRHNIPAKHLTHAELRAGHSGFVEHRDGTFALNGGIGHTDCGEHYPWDVVIPLVRHVIDGTHPHDAPKHHRSGLHVGDTGADVAELQHLLVERHFLPKLTPAGRSSADGIFGNDTRAAVKRAQRALYPSDGSKWSGDASESFRRALRAMKEQSKVTHNIPALHRVLVIGCHGNDVSSLQKVLAKLGFYDGKIDGVFGPKTAGAVADAQRKYRANPIDGKCGPVTWRALWAHAA